MCADLTNPNVIEAQVGSSSTIGNQAIKPGLKNILASKEPNKDGLNMELVYTWRSACKRIYVKNRYKGTLTQRTLWDCRMQADETGGIILRCSTYTKLFSGKPKTPGTTDVGAGRSFCGVKISCG